MSFFNEFMDSPSAMAAIQFVNLLFALAAVYLVWLLTTPAASHKTRKVRGTHYTIIALGILLAGIIIYSIGFYYEGTKNNIVALITRSIISSVEMFVSHSDLIEVRPECKENPIYMAIFSLIHFLAVFINISILFNYFGLQLSALKIVRSWLNAPEGSNLHLFVGECAATKILSADIRENEPDAWIIWVPYYEGSEKKGGFSIGSLITNFSYRRNLVDEADAVGALLFRPSSSLFDSNETSLTQQDKKMQELGLDSANKLIKKAKDVNIYLLSDEVESNVARTQKLCNIEVSRPVSIYCHACRDNLNLALETKYTMRTDGAHVPDVRLVDSAYLTVHQLICSTKVNPINFMGVNPDGTVVSEFNSVLIGFGRYSRKILDFMYEYSAGVDSKGNRASFNCTVVDPELDVRAGNFLLDAPALRSCPGLKMVKAEVGTLPFWDAVCEDITSLNYAVVSLNDDMLNLKTAVSLYNQILRSGSKKKVVILVRCYHRKHEEYVKGVIDFYNGHNGSASNCELVMFGTKLEIFRYNIIFNRLLAKGLQEFFNSYQAELAGRSDPNLSDYRFDIKHVNHARRHYSTMVSHCMHIMSNLMLLGIDFDHFHRKKTMERLNALAEQIGNGTLEDADKILVENIARTEFIRWRSHLESEGYVRSNEDGGERYSDLRKVHKCMVEWDEIPELRIKDEQGKYNYQRYFFIMVKVCFEVAARLIEQGTFRMKKSTE